MIRSGLLPRVGVPGSSCFMLTPLGMLVSGGWDAAGSSGCLATGVVLCGGGTS